VKTLAKTNHPPKSTQSGKASYIHHPPSSEQKSQQAFFRQILRTEQIQASNNKEQEQEQPVQACLIQRQTEQQQEEQQPLQTKPLQRQEEPEEEEQLQEKRLQRQEQPQQEEELQPKQLQRQTEQDNKQEEQPIQSKRIQRQEQPQQEEELQPKTLQRQSEQDNKQEEQPIQSKRIQRQEQPQLEEELQPKPLQRQTEQDKQQEEQPIQSKLLQRQPDPQQQEEQEAEKQQQEQPIQSKRIQRQEQPQQEEEIQQKQLQRQTEQDKKQEEQPIQSKHIQRQEQPQQEEELQPKRLQRQKQQQQEEEQPLQTKLTVGEANDKYEQEADRVADEVMSMSTAKPQRQTDKKEEENILQTKPLAERITPVAQRKSSKNDGLGKAINNLKSGFLQAKGTPKVNNDAEQKIQQMRGQGEPLPEDVQRETENAIGADFSGVNVHNNSAASDLNQQINARAFTLGNDIFFGAGEYAPATHEGKKLLAHELTHVVQQTPSTQRKTIQRTNNEEQVPPESAGSIADGLVNRISNTITFASVQIPAFKGEAHRGELYNQWDLKRSKNYTGSRPHDQQEVWKRGIATAEIESLLRQKAEAASFTPINGQYLFRSPARPITQGQGRTHRARAQSNYYIGSLTDIAKESSAPSWNRRGSVTTSMEVDHIVELNISGFPDIGRDQVHTVNNMELLDRRPNEISGGIIDGDIDEKIAAILLNNEKKAILEYSIPGLESQSNRGKKRDLVRANYDLIFEGYNARGGSNVSDASYWSKAQIEAGDHLGPMEPASFSDLGEQGKALVFPGETGGIGKHFEWDGQSTTPANSDERNWFKPFTMTRKQFWTDPSGQQNLWFGEFGLQIPENHPRFKPINKTVFVNKIPGTNLAGTISKQQIQRSVEQIEAKAASPIQVDYVGLDANNGFIITGEIVPTIPFLENANLSFSFENGEIYVFRTFSANDLTIPSPFSISNSSLTVSINTANGLQIDGAVDFGIQNVGQGQVRGSVNALGEFGVAGEFSFDERIFGEGTEAQVRIAYENNQWSMGGTITIPEGKVAGVASATINVDYSEAQGFAASGEAELDVPGVESGRLEITQNEESGFSIGGEFNLSAETPGIRGGRISARVSEREDGSGYAVSASGTAQPDIPGINSELSVSYNDGAFTAEVQAQYARGMLSGQINAGVTNRSVNEETGELSETAEENNPLVVYGGGSLTLQIAPWLQGTAGVRFAPNGEITITGEIALPNELEIFARREINKSIFNIAVQAPIFPGIVAEIGGGLSATAGIGPGVIDQLRLGVEYNPDREQDTRITGDAHLNIPANAGLRLGVRAGIGLGITGASATGGLEIGGTLGIEGAAEAGVHVEWTPAQGLDLRAFAAIHAQPSFTFDISGYVSVRALGFSVYDQRWQLYSFTYGPDLQFGIRFPVHYQEGQPFDISLSDVEFEVPEIDTDSLLRGLISRIA